MWPIITIVLIVLGVLTCRQASVFASEERVWAQAFEKIRQSPIVAFNLANAEENGGKRDRALEHYFLSIHLNTNQALTLKPLLARSYYNAANILTKSGRPQQAVAAYKELLGRERMLGNDKDIVVLLHKTRYAMGNVLAQMGRNDEAINAYKELLQQDPGYTDAENNLAFVLLNEGKSAESIVHLRNVLAVTPDNLNANFNMARALLNEHQPIEAKKYLANAARALPSGDRLQSDIQTLAAQIDASLTKEAGKN